MYFKTNDEQFEEQKKEALKKYIENSEMVPVVTINKLSSRAKKCFYSFHFENIESLPEIGTIQVLDDGSVRRVEFICSILF